MLGWHGPSWNTVNTRKVDSPLQYYKNDVIISLTALYFRIRRFITIQESVASSVLCLVCLCPSRPLYIDE